MMNLPQRVSFAAEVNMKKKTLKVCRVFVWIDQQLIWKMYKN